LNDTNFQIINDSNYIEIYTYDSEFYLPLINEIKVRLNNNYVTFKKNEFQIDLNNNSISINLDNDYSIVKVIYIKRMREEWELDDEKLLRIFDFEEYSVEYVLLTPFFLFLMLSNL
jgi:hypothetical protein